MSFVLGVVLFMLGGFFGVLAMALAVAASDKMPRSIKEKDE